MSRGEAFKKYVLAFGSASNNADDTLRALYAETYGWRRYLFPLTVLGLLGAASVAIVLVRAGFQILPENTEQVLKRMPPESVAALSGAFIWGMYDALGRFQSVDLSPVSLHYVSLRILVCSAIAPFLVMPLNDSVKPLVAIIIGAFPVQTILDFLKGQAQNRLGFTGMSAPTEPPTLHYLQGMTPSMLQRLNSEGIESVEHLAGADPFKLLLHTNLEWKVILDLIDQAILFDYVGDRILSLRTMGVRGAIEFGTLHEDTIGRSRRLQENSGRLMTSIASVLKIDEAGVRNIAENAFEDVQVNLIWSLWGEAALGKEEQSEAAATE
jgi:hypothetical protein